MADSKNVDTGEKLQKGGEGDCSDGPVTSRGCTDILCLLLFFVHLVGFFIIAIVGMAGGDLFRLSAPRDFMGNYCGLKGQFANATYPENGLPDDLTGAPKLMMFMNVEATLEVADSTVLLDPTKMVAALKGEGVSKILKDVKKYMWPSCASSCDVKTGARMYTYEPQKDSRLAATWDQNSVTSNFSLPAVEKADCPYDAKYCVPFPGFEFSGTGGLCTIKVSEEALKAAAVAPEDVNAHASQALAYLKSGSFGDMMGDVNKTWDTFAVVAILALVFGFLVLVLLRFTVGIIVWCSILLVLALLLASGAYAFLLAEKCTPGAASGADAIAKAAAAVPANCTTDPNHLRIASYVAFGLAGLYALIICCMYKRIRLAIAVNKVAAQFVYNTKAVIFVPLVQVVIAICWMMIWAAIAVLVISLTPMNPLPTGAFTYKNAYGVDRVGLTSGTPGECTNTWPTGSVWYDENAPKCNVTDMECYRCANPRFAFGIRFAYIFFSLLWVNALFIAIGQCTVAGACGVWYFTPTEQKGSRPAVRTGLRNTFRYHMGSLCFGALILAVVQFIRWIMYYLEKQAQSSKNAVMVIVFKALQYLIACFERLIKFLNKNAYIQIALNGKNFCKSAWNAFTLIVRNIGRLAALGSIGGIVHFIGVSVITAATGVAGYFILILMHPDDLSSPVLPTVLYVIVGYLSAKLFMTVFGLAVDTVLQCFVADEELNNGAQYTPQLLRDHLPKQD